MHPACYTAHNIHSNIQTSHQTIDIVSQATILLLCGFYHLRVTASVGSVVPSKHQDRYYFGGCTLSRQALIRSNPKNPTLTGWCLSDWFLVISGCVALLCNHVPFWIADLTESYSMSLSVAEMMPLEINVSHMVIRFANLLSFTDSCV